MPVLYELETTPVAHRNRAVVTRSAAVGGGLVLVVGIALVLVGLWWAALVLVTGIVGAGLWWWRTLPTRLLRSLGASPVDEATHPRLHNVLAELCLGHGATTPSLHVVDDPACNVGSLGWRPIDAAIVVTTGLARELSPVELEAVFAHELVRIHELTSLPVFVGSVFPPARAWGAEVSPFDTDRQALAMTRYPPGMVAAYEKLARCGVTTRTSQGPIRSLWAFDGGPVTLADRIEVLREL